MILAITVFFTGFEVYGAIAGRLPFRDMVSCQDFLDTSTPEFERRRATFEERLGTPVQYVSFCHDLGAEL
jgi:hypothetical protein